LKRTYAGVRSLVVTVAVVTWFDPSLGPPAVRTSYLERLLALRRVWGVIALFLLVIGGMYLGVFTATEAAAVGAFGSFLFAAARGKVTWRSLGEALAATTTTTAMIFAILIGAIILGYFMAVTKVPMALAAFFSSLPVSPTVVMTRTGNPQRKSRMASQFELVSTVKPRRISFPTTMMLDCGTRPIMTGNAQIRLRTQ